MKFQLLFVLLAASCTHGRYFFEDGKTSTEDFGGLISQTLHNGLQDILARFEDDDSSAASRKTADVPKAVDEQLKQEEEEEKPSSSLQEVTIMDNFSEPCTQVETLLQGALSKLQRSFKSLMESLGAAGYGDDKDDEKDDDKDDNDNKDDDNKKDKIDDKKKEQKGQGNPAAEKKEQQKMQDSVKQKSKVGDRAALVQGAHKAPANAPDSAAGVAVAKAPGNRQQADNKDYKLNEDDDEIRTDHHKDGDDDNDDEKKA